MYRRTTLKQEIEINRLITFFYQEHPKDFSFAGEYHNFWELVYVDKGEVEVLAENTGYVLKQGDIIFHQPNEFHNLWANNKIAPNVIVITFDCFSSAMSFFRHKIFKLDDRCKALLEQIVLEAQNAFVTPLNRQITVRKKALAFGAQQIIKNTLEIFLLQLIRKNQVATNHSRISLKAQKRANDSLNERIIKYLNDNIYEALTIADICAHFKTGKSYLYKIFSQSNSQGIMEYFTALKIKEAKK